MNNPTDNSSVDYLQLKRSLPTSQALTTCNSSVTLPTSQALTLPTSQAWLTLELPLYVVLQKSFHEVGCTKTLHEAVHGDIHQWRGGATRLVASAYLNQKLCKSKTKENHGE